MAVLTGNGRAFSAGGDFDYIDELAGDAALRRESLTHGRQIVTGMVACRVPIVPRSTGPRSGWAAASWPCPTSSTWPRAPTSPIPTCWSAWWRRTLRGEYAPPLSLDDPALLDYLARSGFLTDERTVTVPAAPPGS